MQKGTNARLMKTGSVVSAGKAKAVPAQPNRPATAEPMPPATHAQTMGFLRRRFTPYIAGSVMPSSVVSEAEIAWERNFLFLVLRATASAAPPWAKIAPPNRAMMVSKP